eukprot:293075-Chlamydomonas_euryale.AAC.1
MDVAASRQYALAVAQQVAARLGTHVLACKRPAYKACTIGGCTVGVHRQVVPSEGVPSGCSTEVHHRARMSGHAVGHNVSLRRRPGAPQNRVQLLRVALQQCADVNGALKLGVQRGTLLRAERRLKRRRGGSRAEHG